MMGNWVGNKSMVSNWVANKSMVGYWVSNHSVVGKTMMGCAMGDNSTMSMNSLVGRHSRGGGGGSKANKSGNNESLKKITNTSTVTENHLILCLPSFLFYHSQATDPM